MIHKCVPHGPPTTKPGRNFVGAIADVCSRGRALNEYQINRGQKIVVPPAEAGGNVAAIRPAIGAQPHAHGLMRSPTLSGKVPMHQTFTPRRVTSVSSTSPPIR